MAKLQIALEFIGTANYTTSAPSDPGVFEQIMRGFAIVAIFTVLTVLISGCASPTQKKAAENPDWKRAFFWRDATHGQKVAQDMASNGPSAGTTLVWQPFPEANNPLHRQIWNALWEKGHIGDDSEDIGIGRICNYYAVYLLIVSGFADKSYFYDPKSHLLLDGDVQNAFSFYRGNLEATQTNVVTAVRSLLAVEAYETSIINDASEIPHTGFTKDNPGLSFKHWLFSKGIAITPMTLTKKNEHAEMNAYSEYNVFVYKSCGGQLFRYEVRCRKGYISYIRRYLIDTDIGDAWYLM